MADYNNKAVLITGTSSGIGYASAIHLDNLGFQVFATVRNWEHADKLCAEASPRLIPIRMDVTDPATIDKARVQVERTVGERGLWGLVNNAGVGIGGPLEFFPLEDLRWIFDVNLFGLLAVTQAFLPLVRQARGRVVNISSSASLVVMPFHGPYSMTKWSVNAMSNALRLELQPFGVQVSLMIVGSIDTPIWVKGGKSSIRIRKKYQPEGIELYGARWKKVGEIFTEMGNAGSPPEIAAKKIALALTAKRPRNTYYIGADAHQINIFEKLFFGKVRDWLLLRFVGLES